MVLRVRIGVGIGIRDMRYEEIGHESESAIGFAKCKSWGLLKQIRVDIMCTRYASIF